MTYEPVSRNTAEPAPVRRPGTSVLELSVVIAVTGVLLGLVLAAVQRVRDSAYRVTCLNNMRQLGLALHDYHTAKGQFPPGISLEGGRSPYPFLGWNARLLPYLERDALWAEIRSAFRQDRDFLSVPPHVHRKTVIPVFGCPADGRTLQPSTIWPGLAAFTSYLGVAGRDLTRNDGLLYPDSRVRSSDITDGCSNTLLAGERPPSGDEVFGWWYAGWGQDKNGSAEMLMGVREFNTWYRSCWGGPYEFGPGRFDNECDTFHFWSPHPGGGHFAFADGSVRFLSYSANPVLPALATRAGGETAALD